MPDKTFTAQEIAAQLTEESGKTISEDYIFQAAHSIWPGIKSKLRGERFSFEFKTLVCNYARLWHGKHGALAFSAYLVANNCEPPRRHQEPTRVLVAVKPGKTSGGWIKPEQVLELLDKQARELRAEFRATAEKVVAERVKPTVAQITSGMKGSEKPPRANDPKTDRIVTKVKAFALTHETTVDKTWDFIYRRFEERIGIKIQTQHGQNQLQWIRAEGHLDEFEIVYVDLLAEYDDILVGQMRLS